MANRLFPPVSQSHISDLIPGSLSAQKTQAPTQSPESSYPASAALASTDDIVAILAPYGELLSS
jgi:hypothetical protein